MAGEEVRARTKTEMKEHGTFVEKREVWSVGGIMENETGKVGLGSLSGSLYICHAKELACYLMR